MRDPSGVSDRARRPLIRRIFRWFFYFLGGLLVLLVIALVGAKLYFDDDRLGKLVSHLLADNLSGEFRFASIHWRLPADVTVQGVEIETPEGRRVVKVDELRVTVNPLPLIHKTVSVTSIEGHGIYLGVIPTLQDAFKPKHPSNKPEDESQQGSSLAVNVSNVDIQRLSVHVETADEQVYDVGPIAIALEDAALRLDGETKSSSIAVESLAIHAHGSSLMVEGSAGGIGGNARPHGQGKLKILVSLDDPTLRSFAPPDLVAKLDPHGKLRIEVEGSGSEVHADATVNLEGDAMTVRGLPFEHLSAKGAVRKKQIILDELAMRLGEARISAHGAADLSSSRIDHKGEIQLARVPVRRLAGAFVDPAMLPETVSATAALSGRSLTPLFTDVSTTIRVAGIPASLTHGAIKSVSIDAEASLRPDHAEVQSLTVDSGALHLTAHGRVPLAPDAAMNVDLALIDHRPSEVLVPLKVPVRADKLEAFLHAAGTPRRPSGQGTISATGLATSNAPPANLVIPIRLSEGTVRIAGGHVDVPPGRLLLDADAHILDRSGKVLKDPLFHARVTADHLQLAALSAGNASGIATATVTAEGRPSDYRAHASAEVPNLAVHGATLTLARIEVDGNHHRLSLKELYLEPRRSGVLRGQGEFDLDRKSFTGRINGNKLPLSLIADATGSTEALEGYLDLDVQGTGTLEKPRLDAHLSTTMIKLDQQDVGTLDVRASGGLDRIAATAKFKDDEGMVAMNARFSPKDKTIDGRLATYRIKVRKLLLLADQDQAIDGSIGADLFFRGKVEEPDLKGRIWLTGLELNGDPVPGGGSEIRLETRNEKGTKTYRIGADIVHALQIAADVRPRPLSGRVKLTIDNLSPEKLVPSIKERGIASSLHGQGELAFGGGKELSGRLSLDKLHAQFGEQTIDAAQPIVLELAGSNVIVRSCILQGSQGQFQVLGQAGSKALAISAKGSIEMGFIEPLVPQLAEAQGTVQLAVDVGGTPSSPAAKGTISLATPLDIRPRGTIRLFHLERADIRIEPAQITIRELVGGMGGGTFDAKGTIALTGFKPSAYDILLNGQNLSFSTNELVVDADARIRAHGKGLVPSISGEIDVVRGRYTKQFELDRFNFIAKKDEEADNAPSEQPAWLSDIGLDLHAQSTGTVNVKVDAQAFAMKLDLNTDVRISGTAAEPRVDGRVNVEGGEIKFPSAKLPLQGSLDFVPTVDQPIHPVIDMTAEGDVRGTGADGRQRDYHVTVALQGPLEQMTLDLSATELPEKTEVLSLLITGNTDITSVIAGSRNDEPQPLSPGVAFAGSQLAAPATRFLEQQLEQQLNLQLELRTEVTSEGFRVVAGKEVTRRIHLEGGYGRSLVENAAVASTTATLQLTDRFFFEGSAQTINAFGNTVAALQEGAAGRLELKLRVFGLD